MFVQLRHSALVFSGTFTLSIIIFFVFCSASPRLCVHSVSSDDNGDGKNMIIENRGDPASANPLKRYPQGLFPSRIQTGKITKKLSQSNNNNDKIHFRPAVSYREWIPFNPPFASSAKNNNDNVVGGENEEQQHHPHHASTVPQVFVSLSEFATEHQGQLKVRVMVSRVNASGFEMVLGSWSEPGLPHISASWIASDLPAWELQVLVDEQHMNEIEWSVTPMKFDPPLIDLMLDENEKFNAKHDFVAEEQQTTEVVDELSRRKNALLKSVANLKAPHVVSGISKFEQRGDAHWTKLEVQALSVTALGFTSVIRPWGDAPTFWVTSHHLATTLPPQYFRTGTFVVPMSSSNENELRSSASASSSSFEKERMKNSKFFGTATIDFNLVHGDTSEEILPSMACAHPRVVVFIKCYDQAPPRRAVSAAPQNINSNSFQLYYDLRGATDSSQTKFTWVAIC